MLSKQGETSTVVNPLRLELANRLLPYEPRVIEQTGDVDVPVRFDSAREGCHWICLDANAGDSQLLALHQRRAGSAKGVQNFPV
jgi:hypothetical protein